MALLNHHVTRILVRASMAGIILWPHLNFLKLIPASTWNAYSSSASRPGMYSKLTSNTTGLLGATLGLPGADVRPFGNANWSHKIDKNEWWIPDNK